MTRHIGAVGIVMSGQYMLSTTLLKTTSLARLQNSHNMNKVMVRHPSMSTRYDAHFWFPWTLASNRLLFWRIYPAGFNLGSCSPLHFSLHKMLSASVLASVFALASTLVGAAPTGNITASPPPQGGINTTANSSAPVYAPDSDFDYQSLSLALHQEYIELDLFVSNRVLLFCFESCMANLVFHFW